MIIPPRSISLIALAVLSLQMLAHTADRTLKAKYRAVQVDQFDVKEGVQFPAETLATLQDQILKNLEKSKEFQELLRPGQDPKVADTPVLRVSGTITSFNPGSRAKRYVIGFGAGSAEIYAHVSFLDRSTGRTLIAEEVRAVLSRGVLGGKSTDATLDFANQVANTIRVSMLKRLSDEDESPNATAPPQIVVDRHEIAISSEDWREAERKLNEEGAAGYHVAGIALTSKTSANVGLEKFSEAGDTYQYRIIHPLSYTSVEKDLNRAANDGFRYCRHSIVLLGNRTILIAEKPSMSPGRYEYRVHGTVRLSSAQHDAEKFQAEGYELIEEAETVAHIHMLVLEKSGDKQRVLPQSRPTRSPL